MPARSASNVAPLDQSGCAEALGVSRETLAPCAIFVDLLKRWQRTYNLVGQSTLQDPWRRHILDCAQLVPYLPAGATRLVDLGSGAGFPGLVVALLAHLDVHLIESNGHKAVFLREAARATGARRAVVHHARIEDLAPLGVTVVTARALAPLSRLLALSEPHLMPSGRCLFLKSHTSASELTEAAIDWHMTVKTFDSLSDARGIVLQIEDLRPCAQ